MQVMKARVICRIENVFILIAKYTNLIWDKSDFVIFRPMDLIPAAHDPLSQLCFEPPF